MSAYRLIYLPTTNVCRAISRNFSTRRREQSISIEKYFLSKKRILESSRWRFILRIYQNLYLEISKQSSLKLKILRKLYVYKFPTKKLIRFIQMLQAWYEPKAPSMISHAQFLPNIYLYVYFPRKSFRAWLICPQSNSSSFRDRQQFSG